MIRYFLATPVAIVLALMLCVAALTAVNVLSMSAARFALCAICVLAYLLGQQMKRRADALHRARDAHKLRYLDDYRQRKRDNT